MKPGPLPTILLAAAALPASAKRVPPPVVPPVERGGLRFEAPNDNGRRAIVRAVDPASGKRLWEATIFTVEIRPDLEEDVQWVFLERMKAQGRGILLVDERGRRYFLDPATRTARRMDSRIR